MADNDINRKHASEGPPPLPHRGLSYQAWSSFIEYFNSICEKCTPERIPIAFKMALAISALMIVGMITLGSAVINNQTHLMRSQIDTFGRTVVTQVAESVKEPLMADDILGMKVLVSGLVLDKNILGVSIISLDGKILAQAGVNQFPETGELGRDHPLIQGSSISSHEWLLQTASKESVNAVSFVAPIHFLDVIAGYTVVTFGSLGLDQALHDSVRAITAATILMIILTIILSFLMGRRLSQPIRSLIDASKAIGEGNLTHRVDDRRNDEIGNLMQSFNDMAEGLLQKSQVENVFSRYVSPNVAKQILEDIDHVELGGEHVTGSVLFADIVGYTQMSEKMDPSEIIDLLNYYFSHISAASKLYNGTIDKFMGDCAMIVFGVTEDDKEHRFHSVACALLIQFIVERLNADRIAANQYPIYFRIGVNSGEMLAGNMGSSERMQYTVVGDSVNLASRLCTFSEPRQIVITSDMFERPDIQNRVKAQPHKTIKLRNRTGPVTTYIVNDVSPVYRDIMDRQIDEILGIRAAI